MPIPCVKPSSAVRRVLLLASDSAFESEVREALESQQRGRDPPLFLQLVYLDLTHCVDFLAVLDSLGYIRQGIFDMLHIIPPAATWSRSRHSGLQGQHPLRSRGAPLGLSSLNPTEDKKVREANSVLESLVWCTEQALRCPAKVVGLTIVFPEDLGGRQDGPSLIWMSREFQLLEGIRDARRAAGYLCRITGADYKRPLGVFYFHVQPSSRSVVAWLATVGNTA